MKRDDGPWPKCSKRVLQLFYGSNDILWMLERPQKELEGVHVLESAQQTQRPKMRFLSSSPHLPVQPLARLIAATRKAYKSIRSSDNGWLRDPVILISVQGPGRTGRRRMGFAIKGGCRMLQPTPKNRAARSQPSGLPCGWHPSAVQQATVSSSPHSACGRRQAFFPRYCTYAYGGPDVLRRLWHACPRRDSTPSAWHVCASSSGRVADPVYMKVRPTRSNFRHSSAAQDYLAEVRQRRLEEGCLRGLRLQEYAQLKEYMISTARKAGGGLAAYLLLTVDGEAGLCALIGSAACYVYLQLLFRDVDAFTPDTRIPMFEAEKVSST